VLVVGDTPIARALHRIGAEMGLELVAVNDDGPDPAASDLAIVVAAHGRDELHALRRGLEVQLPYVGLVASPKRGAGVLADLRADGVDAGSLDRIDVPAGLPIGAQTPAEIAVSILAKVVAVRRGVDDPAAAATVQRARPAPVSDEPIVAIDPICGMTVAAVPSTPSLRHDGETIYFCCERCRSAFAAEHEHAVVAD